MMFSCHVPNQDESVLQLRDPCTCGRIINSHTPMWQWAHLWSITSGLSHWRKDATYQPWGQKYVYKVTFTLLWRNYSLSVDLCSLWPHSLFPWVYESATVPWVRAVNASTPQSWHFPFTFHITFVHFRAYSSSASLCSATALNQQSRWC